MRHGGLGTAAPAPPPARLPPTGRIGWAVARATLLARGREEGVPLSMSAVIPAERLRGALTEQDIARVRAVQLPLDTHSSAEALRQRMDALAAASGNLPVHVAADVPRPE